MPKFDVEVTRVQVIRDRVTFEGIEAEDWEKAEEKAKDMFDYTSDTYEHWESDDLETEVEDVERRDVSGLSRVARQQAGS